MLDRLVDHLRSTRQPMELFEALKMRTRNSLGLPLLPFQMNPLEQTILNVSLRQGCWKLVEKLERCCYVTVRLPKAGCI